MEKILNVKCFGNLNKKSQKWPPQDLSNIERNKVMKNQPIQGILWRLVHNNQPGGIVLIPPCRIGLKGTKIHRTYLLKVKFKSNILLLGGKYYTCLSPRMKHIEIVWCWDNYKQHFNIKLFLHHPSLTTSYQSVKSCFCHQLWSDNRLIILKDRHLFF